MLHILTVITLVRRVRDFKYVRVVFMAAAVVLSVAAPLYAQSQLDLRSPGIPSTSSASELQVAARQAASGPLVFPAERTGKLETFDLGNGTVKVIGPIRLGSSISNVVMTDIDFCPGGTLYGITFDRLYRISTTTAKATLIGLHRVSGLNALVCNAQGRRLASSVTLGRLYRLSTSTATASLLGCTGSFRSPGDLAYHESGLYLTSVDKKLVKLNKTNGSPLSSKTHNIVDLFGLASTGTNKLYGFAGTKAYKLNEDTEEET